MYMYIIVACTHVVYIHCTFSTCVSKKTFKTNTEILAIALKIHKSKTKIDFISHKKKVQSAHVYNTDLDRS